jgi:hypothetical protein
MHGISPSWLLLASGLVPIVAGDGCPFAKRATDSNLVPPREIGEDFGRCRVASNQAGGGSRSKDFWPCQLKLDVLRQFSPQFNPLGQEFDYTEAFKSLDCEYQSVSSTGICLLIFSHRREPQEGPPRPSHRFSGLVACGFRPLWWTVHAIGMAQRRYLPCH